MLKAVMPMQRQFIGKVSQSTGLSIDAIRFYEDVGLVGHAARTGGNFRVFSVENVHDLRVIRKLLDLGFSLSEMKHVLELHRKGMDACMEVRRLLRGKLIQVRGRIQILRQLELGLRQGLLQKMDHE
jgi:DNA-binding transcriptional MerR regulator